MTPNRIFPGIAPGSYSTTSPLLTFLLRLGLGRLKYGLRGLLVSREVIRERSHPLPIVFGGSVPSRHRLRLEPPASEDRVLPCHLFAATSSGRPLLQAAPSPPRVSPQNCVPFAIAHGLLRFYNQTIIPLSSNPRESKSFVSSVLGSVKHRCSRRAH